MQDPQSNTNGIYSLWYGIEKNPVGASPGSSRTSTCVVPWEGEEPVNTQTRASLCPAACNIRVTLCSISIPGFNLEMQLGTPSLEWIYP